MLKLVNLCYNFEESKEGQICGVLIFFRKLLVTLMKFFFIVELPNQQESITNVLIR